MINISAPLSLCPNCTRFPLIKISHLKRTLISIKCECRYQKVFLISSYISLIKSYVNKNPTLTFNKTLLPKIDVQELKQKIKQAYEALNIGLIKSKNEHINLPSLWDPIFILRNRITKACTQCVTENKLILQLLEIFIDNYVRYPTDTNIQENIAINANLSINSYDCKDPKKLKRLKKKNIYLYNKTKIKEFLKFLKFYSLMDYTFKKEKVIHLEKSEYCKQILSLTDGRIIICLLIDSEQESKYNSLIKIYNPNDNYKCEMKISTERLNYIVQLKSSNYIYIFHTDGKLSVYEIGKDNYTLISSFIDKKLKLANITLLSNNQIAGNISCNIYLWDLVSFKLISKLKKQGKYDIMQMMSSEDKLIALYKIVFTYSDDSYSSDSPSFEKTLDKHILIWNIKNCQVITKIKEIPCGEYYHILNNKIIGYSNTMIFVFDLNKYTYTKEFYLKVKKKKKKEKYCYYTRNFECVTTKDNNLIFWKDNKFFVYDSSLNGMAYINYSPEISFDQLIPIQRCLVASKSFREITIYKY